MGKKRHIDQEYSLAQEGSDIDERSIGGRILSVVTGTFFSLALLIAIGLVTFTIVFFYSRVDGPSMMATLNPNSPNDTDAVLVNRHRTPRRGDMIIVRYYTRHGVATNSSGDSYNLHIKRLIAMGGDSLYFVPRRLSQPVHGHHYHFDIYLNGRLLVENYLNPGFGNDGYTFQHNIRFGQMYNVLQGNNVPGHWMHRYRTWTPQRNNDAGYRWSSIHNEYGRYEMLIPRNNIWYIGDNRWLSYDGTNYGTRSADVIVGVAVDILHYNQSLPQYIWGWVVHIFTFRWLFG